MERTPQPRNRYTPPAQIARGRDFRVIGRSAATPTTAAAEPATQTTFPATPPEQPIQADHANIPIQYPQQHHYNHRVVAAPPMPPEQPNSPIPQHLQPVAQPIHQHSSPYYQDNSYPSSSVPRTFEENPTKKQETGHSVNSSQSNIFARLRNKASSSAASLKTYYSASPKRAALVAGSSLLVLSIIGWTLAMQSSSANDLLAKTPFGFLLINQSHTKGDTVVVIEDKPTSEDISAHKVPANNPRYMTISRLGLFSRVLALESKDQGIELPENIYDVGWSTQSNPPTDPQGTQLYIGHAKGITKTDAAFSRLNELKVSDEIIVETGDGTKLTYIVMHTEKANVSSPNISRYYNSWVIGEPGLNLLTTSGVDPTKENPSENRYATFAVFSILKK